MTMPTSGTSFLNEAPVVTRRLTKVVELAANVRASVRTALSGSHAAVGSINGVSSVLTLRDGTVLHVSIEVDERRRAKDDTSARCSCGHVAERHDDNGNGVCVAYGCHCLRFEPRPT